MSGWSIPGDNAKIEKWNAEAPERRARHEAWRSTMITLRKAANEAEQAAARHWVAGIGHTNPAAWLKAAEACKAAADHGEAGVKSGAWTDLPEGSLEWTQAKHAGTGGSEYRTGQYYRQREQENRKVAEQARENEGKILAKKKSDEMAAAKAAKNKAASDKRKATLAAKKAAGPAPAPAKKQYTQAEALKKWGLS